MWAIVVINDQLSESAWVFGVGTVALARGVYLVNMTADEN